MSVTIVQLPPITRRPKTTSTTTPGSFGGVRIADMPDLGAVDDTSSVVGERAGSGRFAATALRDYVATSLNAAHLLLTSVPTIAALRVLATGAAVVYAQGYYAPGDGGGGVYNLGTAGTDNGGSTIVSANGTYRLDTRGGLSVKQFGAKGDAVADDLAAIQNTIAAVIAGGGGAVYFPAGNYRVTSSINLTEVLVPLDLVGAAKFASNLILDSATPTVVLNIGSASYTEARLTVRDLSIMAPTGAGANQSGNNAVVLTNRGLAIFERVGFYQNWTAVSLVGSYGPTFNQCEFSSQGGAGIYFTDLSANNATIRDCKFYSIGATGDDAAIAIANGGEDVLIEGNDIEGCYFGIRFASVTGISILANYIESSIQSNWFMTGTNAAVVMEGNWFGASPACTLQYADGVRYQNNVQNNCNVGVSLAGASTCFNTMVGQNYLRGTSTLSPPPCAIVDFQSSVKGVRLPNMSTAQKNAIVSPQAGLIVFDTTLLKLCAYDGGAWQTVTSS